MNRKNLFFLATILLLIHSGNTLSQVVPFTQAASLSFPSNHNDVHWGDYDNDGDLDLLATSSIFKNQGNNNFVLFLSFSEIANKSNWGDMNNDGFLDVIIAGTSNTVIYLNQGGSFIKYPGLTLPGISEGNFSLGDYDNDGDLDLLQTGSSSNIAYTSVFRNDGNSFSKQSSINLQQIANGWCTWVDYDNDGDLDIHLTGYSGVTQSFAMLYRNNGDGTFSDHIVLDGSWRNSVTWGDTDADGDLDGVTVGDGRALLYCNNGGTGFSSIILGSLSNTSGSAIDFGDVDNDGKLDLLVTGYEYYVPRSSTRIFRNAGNNTFEEVTGYSFPGIANGGAEWGDYDSDGDLDFSICGGTKTYIFQNTGTHVNTPPSIPVPAGSVVNGADAVLKWHPSTDGSTPRKSMSYNLEVVNSKGEKLVSGYTLTNGFRKVVALGNAQLDTTLMLKNLKQETYNWKVQAIDNGFAYSGFSVSGSFTITSSRQAFSLNASEIQAESASLQWTRGNGISCVVFLRQGVGLAANPVNGINYTANPVFRSGSEISGTGWYCVYNGSGSNVIVTGLTPGSLYQFQVFEMPGTLVYLRELLPTNPSLFTTSLFNNRGPSGFSEQTFPNSLDWGDYDNDGDLDLLYVGQYFGMLDPYGYIYKNNGDLTFTNASIPIDYLAAGDAGWGDYDSDGDLDIFISGRTMDSELRTYVYENKGSGNFIKLDLFLQGIIDGSAGWTDTDNDGDLDIIQTGSGPSGPIFRLQRNMGNNVFLEENYAGLSYGDMEWGDLDNDQDIDIVITGFRLRNGINEYKTIFMVNDGNGSFKDIEANSIPGFANACIELFDPDTDGDLDLVIGGSFTYNWDSYPVTKYFENKGDLQFVEILNSGLMNIKDGSIEAGDLNNDGAPDLLMTGRTGTALEPTLKSKIYFSNGHDFAEQTNIALPDIYGSTAMADLDNDKDLDFFINGSLTDGIFTSVFINKNTSPNQAPLVPSTPTFLIDDDIIRLNWMPVTSDETPAASITYNVGIGNSSGIYNIMATHSSVNKRLITEAGNVGLNTSVYVRRLLPGTYYWVVQAIDNTFTAGNFTVENSFTMPRIQASQLQASIINESQLKLKWTGGNGERVVVFCKLGGYTANLPVNGTAYLADQEFGYGDQIGTSGWYCVYNGRNDSCTVGGLLKSSFYQIMVLEYTSTGGNEIYFPDVDKGNLGQFGTSWFSVYTGTTFKGGYDGDVEFVDFNKDGFLDISVCGFSNYGNVAELYLNNGDKRFSQYTAITDGGLPAIWDAEFTWGDFNNDLFPDFYLTGHAWQLKYINRGGTFFEKQANPEVPVLTESHSSLGDYDSDNDLDLLFSGNELEYPSNDPLTYLYNNAGGGFSISTAISLPQVFGGSLKWLDWDNDGDLDVFLSGYSGYSQYEYELSIFENEGLDSFIRKNNIGLSPVGGAEIEIMDFQNDGLTDILYSKWQNILHNQTASGTYSQNILNETSDRSKPGDLDNDGDADILITNHSTTKILLNSGGEFSKVEDIGIIPFSSASMALGDFDNDGDLDALLNGSTSTGRGLKLFQNNTIMKAGSLSPNSPPSAPVNASFKRTPAGIKLYWSPAYDAETPSRSLTYNVKIGTSQDSEDIASSNSTSTGHRLISDFGNAFYDTTHLVRNLPQGKYYWSVQAVDQAYAGGPWSEVSTFEVKTVQSFFSSDEVCHGLPTHFTDQSVATAGVVSWKWDFRDGTTSSSQNPIHTYSSSGTYNVKLVITDAGGIKDSLEQAVIVKPKPLTGFDAMSVCQGVPVTATNTTNTNGLTIASWGWDFGDAGTSSVQQPAPHPYLNAADYTIKLKARASNGCADSTSKVVSVGSYPVAAVTSSGPLTFCKGDSVTLTVPLNPAYTYSWRISGTNLTGATANTFKAKLSGNYAVEITNPKGSCRSTSPSVSVTALDAPSAPLISLSGNTTFCEGDSVTLTIAPIAGNTYDWKLNGGSVGTGSLHSAKSSGIYSLVVSNASGCKANSTNTVALTVNPKPLPASISTSGSTTFCEGESVNLSVPLNSNLSYTWRNENGPISGADKNSFTALSSGSYRLDIGNSFGCSVRTLPVNVLVKERPAKPLLDSTNYVKGKCPGDNPIKLSVKEPSDRYEYTWYRDGFPLDQEATYIDVYESGYYQLTASLNGCTSESRVFNADFPSGPAKPLIYAQGPSLWYLASSVIDAAKYRWYFNGKLIEGADKYFYVANYKLGQYQVSIGDKDGCYTRSDIITIPPGYTGADDVEPFEGIRIYPNPSSGLFTVEIDNNIFGKLSLEIISPDGRRIKRSEIEKPGQQLLYQVDVSGQPKGMYFIEMIINKFRIINKILLE